MTENLYNEFAKKIVRPVAYNENEKTIFHRDGMKLLKTLALECGIEADFRNNKGGIAVSGEVTMHGDTVYVQLYQSIINTEAFLFLVRSCEGRKDYHGGRNHFHTSKQSAKELIELVNSLK